LCWMLPVDFVIPWTWRKKKRRSKHWERLERMHKPLEYSSFIGFSLLWFIAYVKCTTYSFCSNRQHIVSKQLGCKRKNLGKGKWMVSNLMMLVCKYINVIISFIC
jgi:hypothetical protein